MCKWYFKGTLAVFVLTASSIAGCGSGERSASESTAASGVEPTDGSNGAKSGSADASNASATTAGSGSVATPPLSLDEPEEMLEESGELTIGDAAPMIAIAKWVQGQPIESYSNEKVHVVEFWATWCGPCLASMPHIASLQAEYGDKVAFIGVTAEDEATVSGFMEQTSGTSDKKWSEVLSYRIALDDEGKTNAAFMEAAGQNGIPCAFIVGKSGQIEWIGHPIEIDDPLKQIVDGSWDSAKAMTAARESRAVVKALNETGPKIDEAVNSGDYATAVSLVDGLIQKFPENKDLQMIRFRCLMAGGMTEDANKTSRTLIEAAKDNARELDQIAWMMATGTEKPGIDLDLALGAAKRAVELTEEKDVSAIETMARVQFQKGNVAEAIELQKKTLALASNPRQIEQLQAGLAKYEAALKEAKPE